MHKSKSQSRLPATKKVLALAVSVALAAQVQAQEQSGNQSVGLLEEVVVTATKRATSLQDIPIAITAITGEVLTELSILSSVDLPKVSPGLKVRWQGPFPSFNMRGGGVAGLNGAAVPLYTNGLAGGNSWAGWLDLERVEVMRGPQGTLYGANTLGGLVNIIFKKPDTEAFDYGGAVTAGDYDLFRVEGFVNMPIGENFAVRLTASNTDQDPLIENKAFPNGGLRDEDNSYIRAQVYWAPTDTMDFNVEYTRWKNDSMGNANFGYHYVGLPINGATGRSTGYGDYIVNRKAPINGDVTTGGRTYHNANPATNPTGYYETTGNFENTWQAETETLTLDFNWDLGFADLSVKARNTEGNNLSLWDVDAGPGGLADGTVSYNENDQIDVVLNSKSDQALRWTLGGYWSDSWDPEDNNGTYLWAYVEDKLNDNTGYPAWTYWDTFGSKSKAIYANAEYDITDALTASAGIRYQEDSTRSARYFSNYYGDQSVWGSSYTARGKLLNASYYTEAGATNEVLDAGHTDYKLALVYTLNDDMNFYTSYSTGYIPRSVNAGKILKPNELDAFELGYKSSWADNTLRFNAAFYNSEYSNLSYTVFETCGASICARQETGGSLTSRGFEFELQWQPVDALTIVAGLIIDDTELDEFQVNESVFTEGRFVEVAGHPDGGYYPYRPGGHRGSWLRSDTNEVIPTPTYDLSGQEAAFSPDFIVNLDVSYLIDLGSGGALIPGVTMYHQDDFRTMNSEYFFAQQPSYTTFDLRATWVTPIEHFSIKAYVNNATDELYKVSQNAFSGGRIMADYGRQRMWGIRASYNF
jgi:iron complex outermembrane receptor protein